MSEYEMFADINVALASLGCIAAALLGAPDLAWCGAGLAWVAVILRDVGGRL